MNMDPRIESEERIAPPAPLPHVSRRALKRVSDRMAPPTECRYCRGPVELVSNDQIYGGRLYGDWPYAYRCAPCDAHVGLHPNTDLPLGILADRPLRTAKAEAKQAWQRLSQIKGWKRGEAYSWLAEAMDIPRSECHFGHFVEFRSGFALGVCLKELSK